MNRYPVHVRARRDARLSRWLWLVKWLLLIPHAVVLLFLWTAFAVLTLVAYVAVLFTGRYPRAIFEFNVGVLRWTWRVGYYGYQALGTDRYPPFTLAEVPDYPAGLTIEQPARLPHWLPLLAWLFAIPHLAILGAFTATPTWQTQNGEVITTGISVAGAAVLVLGFGLLFTGRLLPGLYDLLVGLGRWGVRVVAYLALLTGAYPPFRLDQGDPDPADGDPDDPVGPAPASAAPYQPVAPAATRSGGVAGRVVAIIAGVLLLFTGIGLTTGGIVALALDNNRDEQGYITSSTIDVTTETAAVTVEGVELHVTEGWASNLPWPDTVRIVVSGPPGTPLFLGIAPEADVDAWLAGTAHDELTGVYAGEGARYDRAEGVVRPVRNPDGQPFWVADASGTGTVELEWTVTEGRYAAVLTNASGRTEVTADVRVGADLPSLAPVGWGMTGAGLALVLLAVLLIYTGAAGLGNRPAPPGPPTPPMFPIPPPALRDGVSSAPTREPAQQARG
jgi:hypothetical protein